MIKGEQIMSDDPIKDALKMMPYGFYAIGSRTEDDNNAMVANWVMQNSFEPRQLTFGLQKTSYTHELIEKNGVFCVNIFNKEDVEVIKPLMKGRSKNPDKMKEVAYSAAPETGSPVLEGSAAYIECKVLRIVDTGGDHDLVVGEVVGGEVTNPGEAGDTLSLPVLGWSYAG